MNVFTEPRVENTVPEQAAMTAQAVALPVTPGYEAELEGHYVTRMRQRFKAEVNRMTGGGMAALLDDHADAPDLSFLLSYLYALHWLRENVHERYRSAVLSPFRGRSRGFLMDLLEQSVDGAAFVKGYIDHWNRVPAGGPVEGEQLRRLLARQGHDAGRLAASILRVWDSLGLFTQGYKEAYRDLAREERSRYGGMLSAPDRERLALVDTLPDPGPEITRFAKLGVIPAMGCPQTCRHCMFIWRPLMGDAPDPGPLYETVDGLTDSVLFTGGDLTRHLHHFTRAIGAMAHVRTFAILLNGDFANDGQVTERVLTDMAGAVRGRPPEWPPARVLLQISFDEFHQEVLVDKKGRIQERIPVAKIANIVETAPRYPEIQLCLVHKQTALNFSMDLFQKGVFGRLARELGSRGHQVQVLSAAPSPRLKHNPLKPGTRGQVVKDASFVLTRYPKSPILLTSSTIDAYGRAALLDPGEAVNERDLLRQVLESGPAAGETFDIDLMFWFNGWATLFSAVHMVLGDLHREGIEIILARHRKDPLARAMQHFDRRLLSLYAEVRDDLEAQLAAATGPHHLFHTLTEDADVRLHMTRRLMDGS